ncbi:MAG: phosphate acetyltransferase [Rhodospirillaceae bacterium TMED8]|nr:phosphate acetyltransferase [Magnetovibrio sp.]OUT48991.1 MAG: phosphate acetyltransferase [Rhodospirillaceae bacterium TMED8]|tara:strand:- start:1566 stop:2489 length:924 start_codon:yes stop_codon:yes gene_type:complete
MLCDKPYQVPEYLLKKTETLRKIRMAIAGAENSIALQGAKQAADAGLIEPVLVGDKSLITKLAKGICWHIPNFDIVDAAGEDKASAAAVALANSGEVSALMKGHIHTDSLMRAVLHRERGLRTERRLSHIFHMTVPDNDRVLFITDGAINVKPNTDTKIDIINNAAFLARALGNPIPRVALLSATESISSAMPSSVDASEVVKRAREGEVINALVAGPLALDNAISPYAAKLKGIGGPVAGNADILVVPNIETGNGLFKMMAYFMSGLAAGIVIGAKVPIVLTSRADPPEARFAAAALAVITAQQEV